VHRMRWALYLWPGMTAVWTRGAWAGLVVAVTFAAVLNVAILGTLVWSEWLVGWQFWAVWSGVAIAAIGSLAYGEGPNLGRGSSPSFLADPANDLFAAAQQEYLRTHWVEAEILLRRLLVKLPGDASARLMMATLFRHTGRYEEAQQELRRIEALNDGDNWCCEIETERTILNDAESDTPEAATDVDSPEDDTPSEDTEDGGDSGYSEPHELGEAA
jgi:hypothetical protein